MNKTIYISESSINKRFINEVKIPSTLNSKFLSSIKENDFPFKKLLGLGADETSDIVAHFLNESYQMIREKLMEINSIDVQEDEDLTNALSQILFDIKRLEKDRKPELEKFCANKIIELFAIPEDSLSLETKLVDTIHSSESVFRLSPEDTIIDYQDFKEHNEFIRSVSKRHFINIMIAGASYFYTQQILTKLLEENLIEKELYDLYNVSLILNHYLLLNDPNLELSEDDKKELGFVDIQLGNDDVLTTIDVQATNLPILIYESIKGILEVLSAHSLPKDLNLAMAVIKKTDCIKNELWYMRTGIALWNNFIALSENVFAQRFTYLFSDIIKLSNQRFNQLMREIAFKTKKGKRMLSRMLENLEYDEFVKQMDLAKSEKNIIEDEYIHPDEL